MFTAQRSKAAGARPLTHTHTHTLLWWAKFFSLICGMNVILQRRLIQTFIQTKQLKLLN